MTIFDILKDTDYKSEQFSSEAIERLNARIEERTDKKGKVSAIAKCLVRKKDIVLKPEEVVRQLLIDRLINEYGYPVSRMQVEYPVYFGREVKRADIVIMDEDRPTVPYIVIEVKKPKLKDGKDQLKSYPDMIDDQLKYLLFHEAKVHNKKLVILDKEFMIQLLDKYITDKSL